MRQDGQKLLGRMINTALRWSVVFFYIIVLTGCLPDPPTEEALPPTNTPTITPTVTPTIVWFPPTATFTAAPTQAVTPTVNMDPRPFLGKLIFQDKFTDRTLWQTTRSDAGSVAYGNSELTLAVAAPGGQLLSLRKGQQVDDFYLEIQALPSLCRGSDSYGLLLRATSPTDFYRLMISCSGQVRMERYKNSRIAPLQDWTPSGVLFPGAMMPVKIGVWAVGPDMRIFINDAFQFAVKDPVFSLGTIGVYARSAGDTPLTVSFSNLSIYQTGTSRGSAGSTPTATPKPKPTVTRKPTATITP